MKEPLKHLLNISWRKASWLAGVLFVLSFVVAAMAAQNFKDINVSGTATVSGGIAGTLTTPAQPNITSIGILTGLSVNSYVDLLQQATPANPAATRNRLYFKSDDKLYKLNSAGSEVEVGASGANTALSNLVSTAINTDLISDTNDNDDLGSAAIIWNDTYTHHLRSSAGGPRINLVSGEMYDSSNVLSADFSGKELVSSSFTKVGWSGQGLTLASDASLDIELMAGGNIDANSNLITNVLDPVSVQDAATKNYVDGALNSGGGGTNDQREYVSNGGYENTDISTWVLYDDASAVPVDCTGGAVATTFTRTTTAGEVLRKTASAKLSKDAANRQGEGVAYPFTLDYQEYNALKGVPISLEYKNTVNFDSDDIKVYVYDIDAGGTPQAVQVGASTESGNIKDSTLPARWNGTFFPTTNTSDNYRLCIHIATTNAAAYDMFLDSIHIGNQNSVPGAILSDWTTWTPTGTWSTNSTYTGRWRRVGDSMEMQVSIALAGAPNATDLSINLPSGYTIDTARLPTSTANRGSFGVVNVDDSGVRRYIGGVIYASTTAVALSHSESGNSGIINATNPTTFGTSDSVSIMFKVPILNWAATASLSTTELLYTAFKFNAARNAGQTIATSSTTKITNWGTASVNSLSATFTSGTLTSPKNMTALVLISSPFDGNTTGARDIYIYKNGAQVAQQQWGTTAAAENCMNVMQVISLVKGDTLEAHVRQNSGGNLTSGASCGQFSVVEVPDLSVFAAYASDRWYVNARVSGANPDLGVAAVTSYTEITNAGLTLTPISGSAAVGTMCSGTNAATAPSTSATTCAAGDESLGVNFPIPEGGTYEVCAQFSWQSTVDSAEQVNSIFQLIETPTNAQTLSLESGARIQGVNQGMTIATGADAISSFPFQLCGQFNWANVAPGTIKGVRLMYEQFIVSTPDQSILLADENASIGQRNIQWKARKL